MSNQQLFGLIDTYFPQKERENLKSLVVLRKLARSAIRRLHSDNMHVLTPEEEQHYKADVANKSKGLYDITYELRISGISFSETGVTFVYPTGNKKFPFGITVLKYA